MAQTQRRRGPALQAAIYDAVLAELTAVGYPRLTMEGIAARAGTAKSSLYRRWSTIEDLTIAALHGALPNATPAESTGNLRNDAIGILTRMAEALSSPLGRGVGSVIGDLHKSPALQAAGREKIIEPRMRAFQVVFEAAVKRGEVRPGAASPFVIQAGPAIVLENCLVMGLKLSPRDIEDIVDLVVLPALGFFESR